MSIKEGNLAPAFSLPADDGKTYALKDFKGRALVLYFYPKDDTPGCTQEACDFRDSFARFKKSKVQVLGVSKDSVERHQKFREKHDLPFPLLSDESGKMVEKYGVWQEKSLYGRKFMGIVRTTVLIGPDGKILKIFSKVKVKGHVEAVLEALEMT